MQEVKNHQTVFQTASGIMSRWEQKKEPSRNLGRDLDAIKRQPLGSTGTLLGVRQFNEDPLFSELPLLVD